MGEFDLELNWGRGAKRQGGGFSRRPDPWIVNRAEAIRQLGFLLNPVMIRSSFLPVKINEGTSSLPPPWLPNATSEPPPLSVPKEPEEEEPRAGKPTDIKKAIFSYPSVGAAIKRLLTMAMEKVKRDWDGLSTGEKVLTVSTVAVISAPAIADILSYDTSRGIVLDSLSQVKIPGPFSSNFKVKLDVSGSKVEVMLTLSLSKAVGKFLRW